MIRMKWPRHEGEREGGKAAEHLHEHMPSQSHSSPVPRSGKERTECSGRASSVGNLCVRFGKKKERKEYKNTEENQREEHHRSSSIGDITVKERVVRFGEGPRPGVVISLMTCGVVCCRVCMCGLVANIEKQHQKEKRKTKHNQTGQAADWRLGFPVSVEEKHRNKKRKIRPT